jgi:two-component system nitrate/nitrite response regulator NarL
MLDGGGVKVVVADPQPLFRDGISAAVCGASSLELVSATSDAGALEICLTEERPEIVVVGLPHGVEPDPWLKAIRSPDGVTEVVILLDTVDEEILATWVRLGARGIGSRTIAPVELVAAILGVAGGATYLGAAAQELVLSRIRGSVLLTAREQQVLAHLAEGKSTAAIGAALFLGPNTVKTHLHHVYEKLGVSNRAGAVREGMRRGLVC